MEKEELELIMRLKNTKMQEEEACQDLDRALNDPNPAATIKMQSSQGGRASRTKPSSKAASRK